jgi:hypothetical protein
MGKGKNDEEQVDISQDMIRHLGQGDSTVFS